MIMLAVETSTEACSAALCIDGEISERYRVAPREHNALILPMIDDLLDEAGIGVRQIDAVAFGRGPGSFTGVRIATGVAQGIAFALDLPVVPVSTLAALARGAFDEDSDARWAFPCIDARMNEVYGAVYQRGEASEPVIIGLEWVRPPREISDLAVPDGRGIGTGSGWSANHDALIQAARGGISSVQANRFPRARDVVRLGLSGLRLGSAVPASEALPIYVRDQVATARKDAGAGGDGAP